MQEQKEAREKAAKVRPLLAQLAREAGASAGDEVTDEAAEEEGPTAHTLAQTASMCPNGRH